jgi:hypothetical protein
MFWIFSSHYCAKNSDFPWIENMRRKSFDLKDIQINLWTNKITKCVELYVQEANLDPCLE